MAEVGSIFVRIGASIDDFEKAMRKVEKNIKNIESRFEGLRSVGEKLQNIGAKIAASGAAIGAGLGVAVKTAADFDAQMSKVQALAGATEQEFQKLREAAIELGAKSVYSASEAAEGMQILAAAGFNANQIIDAMPGLLNAAAAAGENFSTVADIMVAAMSGFGLQASDMAHIADVLASAANASAISITDIGYSLKYVAPVAKTAGISLEEVSAALAILGNAGIKAEQAGTTLRRALIRLADPPKEAAEMLKQLGIRITDSSGKMLPFQQIIAQLHEKFKGLDQAQRIQAAATIFGAEAMSGMLTLIEAGPQTLASFTEEFQNSTGAAQQMADTMTNNLAGAVEQLKGALESAAISIGTALTPAIRGIVGHIQKVVDWFNSLPEPLKRNIAIFSAVGAAAMVVSGVFLMLIGSIMQAVPGIMALGGVLGGVGTAIGTVLPIIAGLAAAAIAVYYAWKTNFGGFRDVVLSVIEAAKQAFKNLYNAVAPVVTSLVEYIKQKWPQIKQTFQAFLEWAAPIFEFVFNAIASTVMFYLNTILNIVKGVIGAITNIIKLFVAVFTGDWKTAWEAVKQIFSNALTVIWNLAQLWIVGKISGLIKNALNFVLGLFRGFVSSSLSAVTGWVSSFVGRISSWGSTILAKVGGVMPNFVNVIARGLTSAVSQFGRFVSSSLSVVSSLASRLYSIGRNIVTGLWKGISSMGSWLVSKITVWIKSVLPGPIEKLLGIRSPSRLMMEYGEQITKGLAIGIDKGDNVIVRAVRNMAELIPGQITMPRMALAGGYDVPLSAASGFGTVGRLIKEAETTGIQTATGPQIVIEQMVVRNDNDIERIAQRLWQLQQSRLRGQGR